jgi:hypothetical protein
MITDDKLHLTWNNGSNYATFVSTGGLGPNVIDLGGPGRFNLGNGEDLYAVFSLGNYPSGAITGMAFVVAGGTAESGGSISGGDVWLGSSRSLTPEELGCPPIVNITSLANASDEFTLASHGLANGTAVFLKAGTLPTNGDGIANYYQKPLYVVQQTTNTFKLSQTLNGASINWSSDGANLGYRLANYNPAGSQLAQVAVCLDPDLINKGYRYIQARVVLGDGQINQTAVPVSCVITTVPPAQQRWLSYPTSIVVS